MMTRHALVVSLGAAVVLLAGCEQTVAGTAKPAKQGPLSPPTTSSNPAVPADLSKLLLSADDINTIMDATGMEVVNSSDGFTDNADAISDVSCLGALYNAEETVYDGSGWKDVADEVLTEPEDDGGHWVEQTVVRMPSPEKAGDFFNKSVQDWTNCIGKKVTIDDGEDSYEWQFEGVSINGQLITQTARQSDSDGWACDHTLAAKAQYIIESSACANSLGGQSEAIVNKIADQLG